MRFRLGPVSAGYLALDLGAASHTKRATIQTWRRRRRHFALFIGQHRYTVGEVRTKKHHGVPHLTCQIHRIKHLKGKPCSGLAVLDLAPPPSDFSLFKVDLPYLVDTSAIIMGWHSEFDSQGSSSPKSDATNHKRECYVYRSQAIFLRRIMSDGSWQRIPQQTTC